MRTQIYDHRSGLKVVPNDIVADVKNIIWNINPALSKKTVSSLKESVRERLEKEGWTGEYRLDATSRITISSYLRGVGLCFQTGNVGRMDTQKPMFSPNKSAVPNSVIQISFQFIVNTIFFLVHGSYLLDFDRGKGKRRKDTDSLCSPVLLDAFADYCQSPCHSPHSFAKYLCEIATRRVSSDTVCFFRCTTHQTRQLRATRSLHPRTSGRRTQTRSP